MAKPTVAVVGRPNVGKSTLVNRLAVKRDAIVHESRGVTRDRSYHEADWNGRDFVLVDTGGIESVKSKDVFAPGIREQALTACEEADAIIFVVDAAVGVTDEDEEVARILRRAQKPVFLVCNKCDHPGKEPDLWEFFSLGVGEPRPVSAVHGIGTGDLLDDVVAVLPEESEEESLFEDDGALKIAIIGRPNVGKSSLTNDLIGRKRSIVSDVAGTTRDAIDTVVERDGKRYRLIDTAGMRKKNLVHEDVEYYSMVRGLQAIDRADVALLVVDSTEGVTEQDQKVAEMAIDRGCAVAVLLNKWDLMTDDHAREEALRTIQRRLAFMPWAPYLRVSAKTGRSVEKIFGLCDKIQEARAIHIPTSKLNQVMEGLRESGYTVVHKNQRLKVNYVTQTGFLPPVFTLFCNSPELVNDNYRRFIENRFREAFELEGTPIRLRFRRKDAQN